MVNRPPETTASLAMDAMACAAAVASVASSSKTFTVVLSSMATHHTGSRQARVECSLSREGIPVVRVAGRIRAERLAGGRVGGGELRSQPERREREPRSAAARGLLVGQHGDGPAEHVGDDLSPR